MYCTTPYLLFATAAATSTRYIHHAFRHTIVLFASLFLTHIRNLSLTTHAYHPCIATTSHQFPWPYPYPLIYFTSLLALRSAEQRQPFLSGAVVVAAVAVPTTHLLNPLSTPRLLLATVVVVVVVMAVYRPPRPLVWHKGIYPIAATTTTTTTTTAAAQGLVGGIISRISLEVVSRVLLATGVSSTEMEG